MAGDSHIFPTHELHRVLLVVQYIHYSSLLAIISHYWSLYSCYTLILNHYQPIKYVIIPGVHCILPGVLCHWHKNSCDKPQRRSATSLPRPHDDKWTRWSCPKAVFIRWSIGNHLWLVVDLPLWKILVSWGDYSQYRRKKQCFKPPTKSYTKIRPTFFLWSY